MRRSPADSPPDGRRRPTGAPFLDRAALADLRAHTWWPPAVIAVGVLSTPLLVVLALTLTLTLPRIDGRRSPRLSLAAAGVVLRTRARWKRRSPTGPPPSPSSTAAAPAPASTHDGGVGA
ncbi:hypothetical protein ACIBEA_30980 [Streptomyces sp. NPDC051555]|uniref:hypothetical protein n=1 Tax=Streptomyces sp. NPDC051555 TaxID=3365657 RepID=UPI00379B8431